MLDRLGGRKQASVERRRALVLLDDLLPLLDDPDDRRTGLAAWRFAQQREDLFQPLDLFSVSPSCFSKAALSSGDCAAFAIFGRALRIFFSAK